MNQILTRLLSAKQWVDLEIAKLELDLADFRIFNAANKNDNYNPEIADLEKKIEDLLSQDRSLKPQVELCYIPTKIYSLLRDKRGLAMREKEEIKQLEKYCEIDREMVALGISDHKNISIDGENVEFKKEQKLCGGIMLDHVVPEVIEAYERIQLLPGHFPTRGVLPTIIASYNSLSAEKKSKLKCYVGLSQECFGASCAVTEKDLQSD